MGFSFRDVGGAAGGVAKAVGGLRKPAAKAQAGGNVGALKSGISSFGRRG